MKMKRIVAFLVLFLAQIGVAFSADDSTYFGAKVGSMMADISELSDATNIGFVVGNRLKNNISIEGEFTFTAADGDVNIFGFSGDWDVLTIAGYGVYRSNNAVGFILRGKLDCCMKM